MREPEFHSQALRVRIWFFISIRRTIPPAAPRKLSILTACGANSKRPARQFLAYRLIVWQAMQSSRSNISSISHSPPTNQRRCLKPMAYGPKKACMAGNIWGLSARPSSSARTARSQLYGTRLKSPVTPKRYSPRPNHFEGLSQAEDYFNVTRQIKKNQPRTQSFLTLQKHFS